MTPPRIAVTMIISALLSIMAGCGERSKKVCDPFDVKLSQQSASPHEYTLENSAPPDLCKDEGMFTNYGNAIEQIVEFTEFYWKLRLIPGATSNVSYTFHHNGATQSHACNYTPLDTFAANTQAAEA